MNFAELGLSEPLVRAVTAEGYTHPTPIQLQAIPHALAARDLLGCAQTGTGKTAAFALPILHRLGQEQPRERQRGIRVLVLSPTRELASQIAESFTVYGRNTRLRTAVIFGGVSQRPQEQALRRGIDILVATPGRLVDLMNQGLIDLRQVEIFVLDEADRMFDMGFLPDLRRVIAKLPKERQTLFFSATMPPAIEQLASAILRNPVRIRIAPEQPATELVEQSVCMVPQAQKIKALASIIQSEGISRAIVFTRTKHGADRVVKQLGHFGIGGEAIHGNKSQNARQRALANFKANRTDVLVATDLAARGLDVDGVTHVFNYELPHEPETYVHRIGRTGRAGATGIAVSFCDPEERGMLKAIERLTRRAIRVVRDVSLDATQLPAPKIAQHSAGALDSSPPRESRRIDREPRVLDGGAAKKPGSEIPFRRRKVRRRFQSAR